ncbi:ribonuclease H-like domain-containing protein [Paenibacillus sp. NPDC057967]|uniref:ribonuclease H-like domain-containing protein n=1 Tax=Paenibacillus sp. NPDC057967 TaxID=3346293 RepID=UPI0036DEA2F6
MSGLRDRMNRLRATSGETQTVDDDATVPAQTSPAPNEADDGEQLHPGWSAFGVVLRHNEAGSYLIRRTVYPLDHRHGTHVVGELREAASGLSSFHPNAGEPAPDSILYLDLETTGLGVGTGNVPFMVGIGYMSGDSFIIEQTLIRHPAEEFAMLSDLQKKLRNYTYLATYNGKTFDWPLVQNRMIMNAIRFADYAPLHLDFLHPSRSIWRNTLASCKLSHIEEERLGITRTDDVPGSLAPQLYFQYLADGDPAPLEGVFRHNESDLLSLACLSIRFGWLLQEQIFRRIPYPTEAEELVRTGLWLNRMGLGGLPEILFERAMQHEGAAPSSLLMLAASDKKAGNWGRAVLLWQKAIVQAGAQSHEDVIDACIELAMYYEHRTKDLESALAFALRALERHERLTLFGQRNRKHQSEQDSLRNRAARLRRKQGRRGMES